MREPKESPWRFYEPISFRKWLKGSMKPMGYDKALKIREKLSYVYFFVSLFVFNRILYTAIKERNEASSAPSEHPLIDQYNAITPVEEDKEVYLFSFDKFKFKSVEVVNRKELERKRVQESKNSSE